MIDSTDSTTMVMEPAPGQALARKISTEDLAGELMDRAQTDGVSLVGPGGLLADLTKKVLEAMLEGEMTDHVATNRTTRRGIIRAAQEVPCWRGFAGLDRRPYGAHSGAPPVRHL